MTEAIWNNEVIARSHETIVIEGNHYFPTDSVRSDFLRPSSHHTVCGWKGVASYYDVVVGDKVNANAAWYYQDPKPAAAGIRDHVAFWKGVVVK